MSKSVQYITNEQGEKVGVLLDLTTYTHLTESQKLDDNFLTGLSLAELSALASCQLGASEQSRLNELVMKNAASELKADEEIELDTLLATADHLTTLKTRARYTLKYLQGNIIAA